MTDYSDIRSRFERDTANHQMQVLHDDGLYRHLRFKAPGTGSYWFDIVTWPGSLAIRGDVDGYMFARTDDMFEFFRCHSSWGAINPHYWSQKLEGGRDVALSYSEDLFKQLVGEHLDEFAEEDPALAQTVRAEIAEAVKHGESHFEEGARDLLQRWEDKDVFSDTWEWDLRDYNPRFLWACYAISWGIAEYDAARAAKAERRWTRRFRRLVRLAPAGGEVR